MIKRLRYAEGGNLANAMGVSGQALGMAGSIVEAANPPNEYGRPHAGATILKSAGAGAAMGTMILPGWGTAIGAVAGTAVGVLQNNSARRKEEAMKKKEAQQRIQTSMSRYNAAVTADPTLATGVQGGGFYANGGPLFTQFMKRKLHGGSLSTLHSNAVEVKGKSHQQGGVKLPGGQEVEGDETIVGDYVLSDKLGFAQAHKPLAKAIGILEKKAPTDSVLNSLERFREKEQALILFQEEFRKRNNLQ